MKILISDSKVLDTKNRQILSDISNYDIEKKNIAILFNIKVINSAKYCDVAKGDKGIIGQNQSYKAIKQGLESNNREYFEIEETISTSLIFLNEITKTIDTNGTKGDLAVDQKFGNVGIQSYNLSKEEMDKQLQENIAIYGDSTITLDPDTLRLNESNQKELCRQLIVDAKKVIKDNFPYYYCVLKLQEEIYLDSETAKQMGVDVMGISPGTLYINTEFCSKLSKKQLVFILCHEVGHLVFKHASRIKLRNHTYWNFAGDLLINKDLCENEFKMKPTHPGEFAEMCMGIYSDDVDLTQSTEEVYAELVNENQNGDPIDKLGGDPGGSGGGQGGNVKSGNGQNGGGQGGEQNNNPFNTQLRDILNRIRELEKEPVNQSMAPLIERAIKKYDLEKRISALGV